MTTADPTGADILAGYAEQTEFATANRLSTRTVARYRNRADGLPWVQFAGKVYIPVAEAAAWLKNQVRHPNQRRRTA
ncbi:hypothetical protein [Bradyrhizobium sp. Tv2a-2]|uniref:hypothetical protein n=1 Tax=Bradyrhizobium sp. Tv2a-2 TaxID=113395 RepID=UPI0004250BE5|nr:hypothetical protein [Bradyrhizobium sp. Tv2a-2]